MADKIQSFLEIKVNYADAVKKLGEYRTALEGIKQTERDLAKARADGEKSAQEYNEEISALKNEQKQYTDAIRVLDKEIQNNIKEQKSEGTSINALRAKLSNLTKEYDNLTKEQREDAEVGGKLKDQINETTKTIKDAEYSTQRYYRNVGNYPKEIIATIRDTYVATGSLSEAMKAGAVAVQGFAKQLLSLMLNPVVALIAGIAAAIMVVVKSIKRSEEQTNRLKQVTAAFQPVIDAVLNIFSALANVALGVVEGMMKIANAMGLASSKTREYIALERERQALVADNRKALVFEAAVENKVAKLRDKVAQKDKYTTEERRDMLQRAINEEKAMYKARQKRAEREYQLLLAESKHTENDAEMNDRLAEAKKKVIDTNTEYYNATRRLQTQMATFNEELNKGTEQVEKHAEVTDESAKKEVEAIRAAEDALLELMEEGAEKQRAQLNLQYTREIEELQNRLNTEKDLTTKAREAINKTILAKQKQLGIELAKISKEQLQAEVQTRMEQINSLVSLAKKGSEEEYSVRLLQAEQDRSLAEEKAKEEITNAQLLKTQLAIIERQYTQTIDQIEEEQYRASYERAMQAIQERYEGEIAAAYDNELKQAELQAESARAALIQAEETRQLKYETEEAYNARMLELEEHYNQQMTNLAKKQAEVQEAKYDAISSTIGGLAEVFEQLGESNKAFAKLSKVLALGEIAINTGKAISAGIAQAQSVPFPANIAAIATTVTTILAGIASAISTVKSAKFSHGGLVEERQHYATGGNVRGAGSGTSDSIPAMLSNGESVMTSIATSMFAPILSSLNQLGGGVPISAASAGSQAMGEEMLARAVARGVSALPNPVVSVEEINTTQQRVTALENLASL